MGKKRQFTVNKMNKKLWKRNVMSLFDIIIIAYMQETYAAIN